MGHRFGHKPPLTTNSEGEKKAPFHDKKDPLKIVPHWSSLSSVESNKSTKTKQNQISENCFLGSSRMTSTGAHLCGV